MFLWFVIVAPVLVAEVFRSPMIDYRVVAFGALLPVAELLVWWKPLHSLVGAIVVLALVMAFTQGRRLVRRRWLGLPIGLFLHLMLNFVWTVDELFLWPFLGVANDGVTPPLVARPLVVSLILELIALAVGWWAWRRYQLGDASNRQLLVKSGQLNRAVLTT